MSNRPACRIAVEVNLDGVPGWGYEADDFRAHIERAVMDSIPHYKPVVTVECERFSRDQGDEQWPRRQHPYTVDAYLVGPENPPCVVCGKGREEHR